MENDIEKKVINIISEQLFIKKTEITDKSKFLENLGTDSLDIAEVMMALEEEFGMGIPDEEADKLKTVGQTIKYIEKKINNKGKNE